MLATECCLVDVIHKIATLHGHGGPGGPLQSSRGRFERCSMSACLPVPVVAGVPR